MHAEIAVPPMSMPVVTVCALTVVELIPETNCLEHVSY